MNDYEERYKAFCIDEDVKKQFSGYTIGIETAASPGPMQIETKVVEDGKTTVIEKENAHAELV